jgi:hypothetical protein
MRHIKTYEKFNLPFFKKKVKEPAIEQSSSIIEIPVSWTSSYDYKGKSYMLEIGDYTNHGFIKKIIEDIAPTYITDEGYFYAEQLTVFKGDEDELKIFIDSKKYNL